MLHGYMPKLSFVVPGLLFISACTPSETTPSTTTAPASSASTASAASAASPASSAPAEAAAHAFHYDFALTITEGTTTQKTSFTLDVSDRMPGWASVAKNTPIGPAAVAIADGGRPNFGIARADVGTSVKAKLTMEGDVPHLDLDANISSLDTKGAVHRSSNKVNANTPVGTSVTLFDKTEEGRKYVLTATATAAASLGAPAPSGAGASQIDVVVTETGGGGAPKTTPLTLALMADTPATANSIQTIPLSVTDGGVSPRQDTGTRVKATAHPRASGLDLEFDLEMTSGEPGPAAMTIRKLTARGPVPATYEKPTKAFVAEDDGRRYEVTLTAHRPK